RRSGIPEPRPGSERHPQMVEVLATDQRRPLFVRRILEEPAHLQRVRMRQAMVEAESRLDLRLPEPATLLRRLAAVVAVLGRGDIGAVAADVTGPAPPARLGIAGGIVVLAPGAWRRP